MSRPPDITRLLHAAADGDDGALESLLPLVYDELRRLANAQLRRGPPGSTLQPTALVHDAYLRMVGGGAPQFENRRHFFFAAARAIHDLLIQDARKKRTAKRGGDRRRVDLDGLSVAAEAAPDDLLALEQALEQLAAEDPRKHRIVELRFFAGLPMTEVAQAMDTPLRSLEREWSFIRAWLARQLDERS